MKMTDPMNPFRFSGFDLPLSALVTTWSDSPPPRVRLGVPLTQYSIKCGTLTVPAGFVCDGASIPKAVRWYHDPFDTRTLRAAIVHDLRCATWPADGAIWHIGTWQEAHDAFAEGCEAGGLTGRRLWAVTNAVKLFGPRWPKSQVIPVADAAEFLSRFPLDWDPNDRRKG